jgi:alpha-tubulin suppressor-like RCC1 family protein
MNWNTGVHMRSTVLARALLLTVALVWATACWDGDGPVGAVDQLAGLIVSAPVGGSAASLGAGPARAAALSGSSLVYVSLAPGSVSLGLQAKITNQATGQAVTTYVVNGGFDPVAIAASVGDTLAVEIGGSGSLGRERAVDVVRRVRPPKVVRTNPPAGGHDIPLNSIIVVVFSEPVDSASVDSTSVTLWRGSTRVSGTVRFADSLHLRMEFHPDSLLSRQTDYQLVLTTAIQDVNGLALDSAVTVPFTTGTTVPAANLVFTSVSAGYRHTCGVTTTGAAYCWGSNSGFALGDGTDGDGTTTPVPVAGGLSFASVSAGFQHTCGVTTSGAAYCWGVGSGTSPLPVPGGLTFASVSAGGFHDCGVTTMGAAYCWGNDETGQLGDGTPVISPVSDSETPVLVAGGLSFREVSAGMMHSCGVTTAGTAYCWGENTLGELGIGTSNGPEECLDGDTLACSTRPIPIAGGLTFATVSAGDYSTCGVTTSGAPYCWGEKAGPEQCDVPQDWLLTGPIPCSRAPLEVPGEVTLASVSAHRSDLGGCGLTSTGVAYCWGGLANTWWNNTGLYTGSPLAVPGGLTFATLSAGWFTACGVTTAGVAYCWGNNESGELGDGTTTGSGVPVKVAGQR